MPLCSKENKRVPRRYELFWSKCKNAVKCYGYFTTVFSSNEILDESEKDFRDQKTLSYVSHKSSSKIYNGKTNESMKSSLKGP